MSVLSNITVRITTLITQLAGINLLALALIVLGLGVFGLAPALVACFWAIARLDGHSTGDLMRGMCKQYKAEFLRANLIALPAFAGSVVLCVAELFAAGPFAAIAIALAVLLASFGIAATLTLATLSGTVADGWANATMAASLVPYRLLIGLSLLPCVVLVALWQPLLGVYFGLSAWVWLSFHIIRPGLSAAIPNTTEVSL